VPLAKNSAARAWGQLFALAACLGGPVSVTDVRRCWSKACRSKVGELGEERSWYASPLVLPYFTPHCKGDKTADRDHFGACHADRIWFLPPSVFCASQKVSCCQSMIGWLCVLDVDLFAKGFDAVVSVGCKCLSRCV